MSARYQFPGLCWAAENCTKGGCLKEHDIHTCICGMKMSKSSIRSHLTGKKHADYVRRFGQQTSSAGIPNAGGAAAPQANVIRCNVCEKDIPSFSWQFHLNHRDHLAAIQAALGRAGANKNGVEVSGQSGVDFGVVEQENASSSTLARSIDIRSTDSGSRVSLVGLKFTSSGANQTTR